MIVCTENEYNNITFFRIIQYMLNKIADIPGVARVKPHTYKYNNPYLSRGL